MCYNWRGDIMKNSAETKKNIVKKSAVKANTANKKTSAASNNKKKSTAAEKKVASKASETTKKTAKSKNTDKANTKAISKNKKVETIENKKTNSNTKINSNASSKKNITEVTKDKNTRKEKLNNNNLANKKTQTVSIEQSKTKKGANDNQENFITKEETRKVAIVIGIIVAAFGIFFIVSKIMDKNEHSDIFSESLDIAEVQYTDILISKLLNQNPSEYYVLVEYSKDENLNTYEGYITNYKTYYADYETYKIYTAQLDNAFNKAYYGEKESYDANTLSFSQTTLVKVSNGEITEAYTENDISVKIQGLIEEASNEASN